jgi:hypothetical protein
MADGAERGAADQRKVHALLKTEISREQEALAHALGGVWIHKSISPRGPGCPGRTPNTVRRHYAKRTPEYQSRHDAVIRLIHGTNMSQTGPKALPC